MVMPAGRKLEGIGEFIPFARAKFKGGGKVGDGAEAEFGIVEFLANEV